MTLDQVVAAVGGTATGPVAGVSVSGVSTDSRAVQPGDVFVAIRGERFDGHEFIEQAFASGAVACVVSRPVPASIGPTIVVDDTVAALGRLAAEHRRRLSATVIAVTGSNGKTTTKAMIDHVLGTRLRGRAAVRSFNNHIGVPLTLLSAEPNDEYLVVEIGSSAPGEVGQLAAMASPDVGVITSIGPAHLDGFGGMEGVVREKTSLLRHVRQGGLAVVNADGPGWPEASSDGVESVTFGRTAGVELRVMDVGGDLQGARFRINGGPVIHLPVCGAHNALNAAATLAVCGRLGFGFDEAAAAMASYRPADMRLNVNTQGSITVIDDSYNANPSSMFAAIEVLTSAVARRRVLVAGDMLELGTEARRWHERIGAQAGRAGVDRIVAVGSLAEVVAGAAAEVSPAIETWTFANADQACARIGEWLGGGDVVLVKGSRAMGLERVARAAEALAAGERTAAPAT